MIEWACPSCGNVLRALRCGRCEVSYPQVESIPVLVRDARRAMGRDYLAMMRGRGALMRRVDAMRPTRGRGTARHEVMDAMVSALERTLEGWTSLVEPLAEHLHAREVGEQIALEAAAGGRVARGDASYDEVSSVLDYAVRDWSGQAGAEQELAQIASMLPRARESDHALVLGAGAGRIAADLLGTHRQVLAIERSLAMAMVFARCRSGSVALSADTHQLSAALRRACSCRCPTLGVDASGWRGGPGDLDRLRYAVADARALPVPDESVDVVYSVFFTDVIPLRVLLPELRRVLRPGGRFVHLGPLLYHFPSELDKLHVDELPGAFAAHGFTLEPGSERWSSLEHLGSESTPSPSAKQVTYVLAFEASKREVPALGPQTVLRLAAPLEIRVTARVPASGGSSGSHTRVHTVDGRVLAVSPAMARVLECVDGTRTIEEIAARLDSEREGVSLARAIAIAEGLREHALVGFDGFDGFDGATAHNPRDRIEGTP